MKDVRLTHIGGPTVLIETGGWRLLTDPTFDAAGRRYGFGWGGSSRKLSGPAVRAEDIGHIDAVLLTHDHHADNLDDAGRALLPAAGAVITTASAARRLGGTSRGLEPWESTALEASGRKRVDVTATPCRHGPPHARFIIGDVVGFAVRWEDQEHGALWISGDTVLYDGVRSVAGRVTVDLAIVHLGAVRFPVTGPVRYTLTASEAVDLCTRIRPRTIVPVHVEGWSHFSEGRAAAERTFASAPADIRARVRWLPPGVATDLGDDVAPTT